MSEYLTGWCMEYLADVLLARAILPIPATSTPSERIFSTAELTVTRKRSQLSPSNVNKIVYVFVLLINISLKPSTCVLVLTVNCNERTRFIRAVWQIIMFAKLHYNVCLWLCMCCSYRRDIDATRSKFLSKNKCSYLQHHSIHNYKFSMNNKSNGISGKITVK